MVQVYNMWQMANQVTNQLAVIHGCITFGQFSCFSGKAIIHAKAVDTGICQCHLGCAVNGTNQVVGDVVGKDVSKPIECVVEGMCICKRHNDGVIDCMLLDELSGELACLESCLGWC